MTNIKKKHTIIAPLLLALFSSVSIATAAVDTSFDTPNVLWHNSSTGAVEYMPIDNMMPLDNINIVGSSNTNLIPVGNGDLTGDNIPDILFHNQNSGKVLAWEMDGTTKVQNIDILLSSNTNLQVAGLGDFDGDGDNDIATFNKNSGNFVIWVMEGTTKVRNETVLNGNVNLVPQGVGDMDNDGIPDVILRNDNSGAARIWTMNSDFTRKDNVKLRDSSNTNLELRGVIDIDEDGNNDILNYNTNTGMLRAWLMDGNFAILANPEVAQEADFNWSARGGLSAALPMTEQTAKETMALNAILYPIAARVAAFPVCFDSIESLKTCLDLIPALAPEAPEGAQPVEQGYHLCTSGSFDYNKTGETYSITFNDCEDDANAQNLQDDLVIKACVYGVDPEILPGNTESTGTYKVIYNGNIVCAPEVKTATNYSYRTIGNNTNQTKRQWTYNATIDLTSKIILTGSVRGLAKYGDADQDWDDLFLGSDEEWIFSDLSATLGDTMILDGRYSYLKHPNDNEPDENETKTVYIDFKELAYTMITNGSGLSKNLDANVTGKVSASCHPEQITYGASTTLEDMENIRDINGSRMPSAGEMKLSLAHYNTIPAQFDKDESAAQVNIISTDGDKLYAGWREITTGSSCQNLQDTIDNILPGEPVNPPDSHSTLVEENILFEKEGSLTFTNDNKSVTGETDGTAVWYFVAPENGYANDGSQTVAETYFDFNATKAELTNEVFVNVYLKDTEGNNQKVNIYKSSDWTQVQTDHPDWTIRSDYWESNFNPTILFNGNFILRFGDSTYSGTEEFTIEHYDVGLMPM